MEDNFYMVNTVGAGLAHALNISISHCFVNQREYYHKATLPAIPKSRVAVAIPNALNTRLIVGMLILYPLSMRDI